MKTLAILTIAAASLFGAAAHANDIDHWAGDDGKRPYYAPGGYGEGYVRSFNSFSGPYPGVVVQPAPAWGGTVVMPRHRRPAS